MPNNNPHGHNQYTRNEDRSTKGPAPVSPTADTVQTRDAEPAGGATPGASRRGFASMDAQTQREITSKGGEAHGTHR